MDNLDALLNKIRTEGLTAAKAEADALLAKAKKEAEAIVAEAKKDAERLTATAKADADRTMQVAEATIRQAARDVLLKLEQDITALLERTLGGAVETSLKSAPLVEKLIADAVAAYTKEGAIQIVAGEEIVKALKATLAAQKDVTVITDARMGTGFRVKLANGRVEHDFTGASITDALAVLLRPQLAKLLKD